MNPIWLTGRGLFTPGFASPDAWLAGVADAAVDQPECAVVNSRLKRATSLLTRMCVDVASQAAREAGVDAATVATVFASANGEIHIAIEQIRAMFEEGGTVSPARFKNSVHNTASGIWSIATQNHEFTTAVAAGAETLAMGLLEAWALLHDGTDAVIVVVGDEPAPPPLPADNAYPPLALAFTLARAPGQASLGRLSNLSRDAVTPLVRSPAMTAFDGHVAVPGLHLLRVLASGTPARCPLVVDGTSTWAVDVEPGR